MSFYNNFIALCSAKGLSCGEVCLACGLSESIHSKWKNSSPKGETIIKVAEYLQVSTDKLLLDKDPELSSEHKQIIDIYESLSVKYKKIFIVMLNGLFESQTESENEKENIIFDNLEIKPTDSKNNIFTYYYSFDSEDVLRRLRGKGCRPLMNKFVNRPLLANTTKSYKLIKK